MFKTLNGSVNCYNCRYFIDINYYWYHKAHIQYPVKVNVWGGIVSRRLIRPIFIERHRKLWGYASKTYHTRYSKHCWPQFPELLVSTRWCSTSLWSSDMSNFFSENGLRCNRISGEFTQLVTIGLHFMGSLKKYCLQIKLQDIHDLQNKISRSSTKYH